MSNCCPNGIFVPLIRDCTGDIRPLQSSERLRVGDRLVTPVIIDEDIDLYVSPGGSDYHGSGTIDKPFRSFQRAQNELFDYIPRTQAVTITVHIDEGFYLQEDRLQLNYPYGGNVFWSGEVEEFSAGQITLDNFSSVTSAPAEATALQYYDMDCEFPAATEAAVGYFVLITTPSGGTNNPATRGLHKIIDWDADNETATVRVWQVDGVPEQPSGSITAAGAIIKSVLISEDTGIIVLDPVHGGTFNNLVVEGEGTDRYDNNGGIVVANNSMAEGGTRLGFHNWDIGSSVITDAVFRGRGCHYSKIGDHAMFTDASYNDNFPGGIINGTAQAAVSATNRGQCRPRGGFVHSCGSGSAIDARENSYIDCQSLTMHYDDGSGTALFAQHHSTIIISAGSITGYATDKNPASNPGTNGSYIIGP